MKQTRLRTAAAAITLILGFFILSIHLYVNPSVENPSSSDVLFVLAPSSGRASFAEDLMEAGFAETLVVSTPASQEPGPPTVCDEKRKYRVICFAPDPVTTRGEARELRALSQEHGWNSATVITAKFHVSRARVIFQRCFGGELSMVAIDTPMPFVSLPDARGSWLYHIAYESAAFVKTAIDPTC